MGTISPNCWHDVSLTYYLHYLLNYEKETQADKLIMKDKQRQAYLFPGPQIKTDTALINNNT